MKKELNKTNIVEESSKYILDLVAEPKNTKNYKQIKNIDQFLKVYKDCLPDNEKISECPFKRICDSNGLKNLQPPKSISILGQTGWTSAYTEKGNGGGGLMA